MSTIDERIVSMVFENAKFEAGIAQSMASLTKFDDALKKSGQTTAFSDIEKQSSKVSLQGPLSALDKLRGRLFSSGQGASEGMGQIEAAGNKVQLEQPVRALDKVQTKTAQVGANAAQGFSEIESASGKVSLQGLTSALDSVTGKFSVLQGAASVAMGNITSQAAMKGGAFAKSFALGPLQQGFGEYQTNLQSIQTILANTEGQKVSGLDNVNKSLGELNTYSDQTIYNFSEMAKNIGTFTAAGVDLPQATSSIKGIANLAALSGSNSQQASTAMYQLSQAISAGRVGLQDWNSVVNAGMGGAVFQKSLMRTAENMGALKKGAVEIDKATGKATVNGESFRNSIMAKPGEESWLTSDVLTKTLGQMTGDMSDAQLKAQGFSAEQVKAIQKQAKTAKAAATEVKTLPQVWDVARETIGSGWAQSAQLIFGNFKESKKTFTELSNAVNGVINNISKARNHLLKVWKDLGGRTELIKGIKSGLKDISRVIDAVRGAFQEVFPKKTGKDLFNFTVSFRKLMDRLLLSPEAFKNLTKTFQGFFAILHIGMAIIKGVASVITGLLGVVGHGSGGFLNLTGSIGEFLTSADKALTKGGALSAFFDRLTSILKKPMEILGHLTSGFSNLFGGKMASNMDAVKGASGPLGDALNKLKSAWAGFVKMLSQAKSLVSPWLDKIGKEMARIGDVFKSAFSDQNIGKTTAILQTALLGGILLAIRKAITGGVTELGAGLKGIKGVLGGMKEVLGGLTNQLKTMQQGVKAKMILQIAIAVGILSAATYVLAKIPADDLAKAMSAIAVGLGEVMGSMRLLAGGTFGKGAKFAAIATGMILISSALLILAGAMKVMSTMSWEEITRGFAGLGGGLAVVAGAMTLMPPGPAMVAQSAAIVVIAGALNGLAIAMKIFASMSWEELGRGLAGVLFSLTALIVPLEALTAIGPGLLLTAPALIGIGIAMNLLATSVKIFASMDPKALVKGLFAFTGTLLLLSEAMWAMPPGPMLIMQGAGMMVLAAALQGIAVSLAMFGGLGVGQILKGLLAMGGALLVLGAGLIFMEGALPGAAALVVAATGIAILAPALGFLGSLKIFTIVKGLAAIAAVLAVLALAGTFAAPGIAALGTAMYPLAGVLVAAAGATFLFAKALEIMGGAGAKGVGVMVAAITAFVLMLPNWIITLLKGVVEITEEMAKVLPKVIDALDKILTHVIAFVIREAPKLGAAITILIGQFLKIIDVNGPRIMQTGTNLLLTFLSGVSNNIGKVTNQVANIITRFLTALTDRAPDLLNAGSKFLGTWLTGIGNRIGALSAKGVEIVAKFLGGIASRIQDVVHAGSRIMTNIVLGLGQHATDMVTAGVTAILHFLSGLGNNVRRVINKGVEIAGKFVHGVASGLVKLADVGAKAVIDFLNGLAGVIRHRGPELRHAGANLASAIIEGMTGGFGVMGGRVKSVIEAIAHKLPKWMQKVLGIQSPSTVFHEIGVYTMQGMANGLISGSADAENAAGMTGSKVIDTMQKTMSNVPGLLDGIMDMDPTIRPVLDLTQVKKDAGQLGDITKTTPITTKVSANQAAAISQEKATTDQARAEMAAAASRPAVEFKQYNTSPESLSETEIYRRTSNQLSKIRKEIGLDPFPAILGSGAGT